MNKRAFQAYQKTCKSTPGGNSTLAQALTKAARLLDRADPAAADGNEYVDALMFNRTLWTIIQADVTDDNNALPDDIKANILSLSLFVDRKTYEAAANPSRDGLVAMININRNMAEGLFASG